jgi:hypothetical protein
MTRSRRIFLIGAIVFAAFLAFTVYDISRRTSFPGSRKTGQQPPADSLKSDSSAKSVVHPR